MRTSRRIMLVDGSDATRKMVAQLLKKHIADIEVTSVGNAREAFARLKQERFDLITTALALPDLDGLELTRAIRTLPDHAATPVIVVSGDAAERIKAEGDEAGVTDYFDKSLGLKHLVDFIRDALPEPVSQQRVLYVEDSMTAAMAVRRILDRLELDVVHVLSAEEALDHLERSGAGPNGFDIVISDLFLKGRMSGTDLVKQIRHTLEYTPKELPVLMVTVEGGSKEDYRKLLACGANDYVTKPLTEPLFISRLKSLLSLRDTRDYLPASTQTSVIRSF